MSKPPLPYVYIIGLSHSGSTLLAFLLNAHPELVSIGEASRLGEILPERWRKRSDLCSCGKPFYHCEFWNRSLAGLAARGFGLRESDPFDGPNSEKAYAQKKWRAFVESVLEVSPARVFVDASKVAAYAPVLDNNRGLDLKYINLLRDGRGVILSWQKRLPDTPVERIIKEWINQENHRRANMKALPADRVLDVKYEDLCTRTDESLAQIFRFVGVDPAAGVASGYKTSVEHHVIGNPMRLDQNEAIRLDEKWRRDLAEESLKLFSELGAAQINRQNGYDS